MLLLLSYILPSTSSMKTNLLSWVGSKIKRGLYQNDCILAMHLTCSLWTALSCYTLPLSCPKGNTLDRP
jgi:hypothetical protein